MPAGTSSFTVRVADAAGQDDTQALSITSTSSTRRISRPPRSQEEQSVKPIIRHYKRREASGHSTWSLSGGSLPAMLSLSPDGVISGTPTNTGTRISQ